MTLGPKGTRKTLLTKKEREGFEFCVLRPSFSFVDKLSIEKEKTRQNERKWP